MGQRLVVTIRDKGVDKMKIYYHWSGYTSSTFEELSGLWFNCIKPLKRAGKTTDEILLGIIRYLEGNVDEIHKKWLDNLFPDQSKTRSCHGGIGYFNKDDKLGMESDKLPNRELEYIQSLYPGETFDTHPDRNNGLVYMSKDGMADAQMWSEGDAEIDLDAETFRNDVHWLYDDKEYWIDEHVYDDRDRKETEKAYDSMSVYNGNGLNVFVGRCDDIDKCWNTWGELVGKNGYQFKDTAGIVWEGLA